MPGDAQYKGYHWLELLTLLRYADHRVTAVDDALAPLLKLGLCGKPHYKPHGSRTDCRLLKHLVPTLKKQ